MMERLEIGASMAYIPGFHPYRRSIRHTGTRSPGNDYESPGRASKA